MAAFFRQLIVRCAHRMVPNWVAWVVFPLMAVLGVVAFFVVNNEWCLTLLVFLLGVVPNFLHQWVCEWQKDRLKSAKTFFANHDLSRGVGQAIRLILLDAAEDRAGDLLPKVKNQAARAWLKQHAQDAPTAWQAVIDNEAGKETSEYAALFENQLWRFIERRDKKPLEDWAWVQFLRSLNNGHSLPFEADTAAAKAIVHRLNARFGEALWEFIKNAFANNDPAAEAMHLLIAGELLKRTSAMAEGVEALKSGLAALQTEWSAHKQAVEGKLNAISSKQDWTIRMLHGQYEILKRIEGKLDAAVASSAEARDAAVRVEKLLAGTLPTATLKTAGNLAAIRLAPNQFFTGRTDELGRLHAALAGGSVAIVHALTGEGGIGKTELAKVYALIYGDTYDSAWWLDASGAALRGELVKVYKFAIGTEAPQNAQTDDLCQALVDQWRGTRPLIILDNVDDPANFTLFSALPTARVLATTRQHHKTLQGVEPFALGVLPIPDAVALMRKEVATNRADVTDADLTAIAKELDGHALAVALAGAHLANYPSYSATEVLAKLKASKVGDVEPVADDAEHDALGLSYRKSVAASLSLSFAIPQVAAALPVLAAASFLHPTGITIEWLTAGTGWDKDKVIKAAAMLAKYSIIKDGKTISLHRLTQGVARSRADVAGGEHGHAALTRLLDALIDLFRWPATYSDQLLDHTKTPARLAAVAHAEAVIAHAEMPVRDAKEGAAAPLPRTLTPAEATSAGELGAKVALLRGEMGKWFPDVGMLSEADRHLTAAIRWAEAQSPRDERSLAIRYASRAGIRQSRGDLAGAEADIKKSIDWGEAQSPRDERGLAILYASRAIIRRAQGDLAGAEADIKKSIDWGEARSPRDERSLAIWYASRASIRQDRGDLAGAEADIQKSIDWGEAQSPRDERSLAIDYASRASIRQSRGDLAGAEDDIRKSIDWGEAQSPRDERSLAIWYASRADLRRFRGDLAGAEDDIRKSITWFEAQSPRDEHSLAFRYKSKALILAKANKFAEAKAAIDASVRLHTAAFGADHEWTRISVRRQQAIHAGRVPR